MLNALLTLSNIIKTAINVVTEKLFDVVLINNNK